MLTPKEYAIRRRRELTRARVRRSREKRAAACASHLKEDGGQKVTETEQA